MSTVTCSNCNSKNTEGSKFCNHCGNALPLSTHIACPNCATRNQRNLMYCDNCGTRLLPTGELSSEREADQPEAPESREGPKAFSLPARDPGDELDPNRLFDWLRTGEEQPEEESESPFESIQEPVEQKPQKDDEVGMDGWLDELSDLDSLDETSGEGDVGDWLTELEGIGDDDPETAVDTDNIEDTLPNWLDELNLEDSSGAGQEKTSNEATLTDWFIDFEDNGEAQDLASDLPETDILGPNVIPDPADFERTLMAPSPFQEVESDESDWLSEVEEESDASGGEEAAVSDWLSDLDAETDTPTVIGSTESSEEDLDALPDWLTDVDTDDEETSMLIETADPTELDDETLPPWLTDFDSDDEETPTLVEPAGPTETDNETLPDWLADPDSDDEETSSLIESDVPKVIDDEALPDWLSDVDSDDDEMPTMVESAVPTEPGDEPLPEWLNEADSGENTPTLIGSTESTEMDDEDLPDWLSDFEEADEESPTLIESAVSMEIEDEALPDWLGDFDSDDDTPTLIGSVEPDEASEGLSDWLGDLDDDGEAISEIESTDVDETEEETLPDWLSDIESEGGMPTLIGTSELVDDSQEVSDWLADLDDADDSQTLVGSGDRLDEANMPTWIGETAPLSNESEAAGTLSEFEENEEADDVEPDATETAEPEGIADWLGELGDLDERSVDLEATETAETEGIADWLDDLGDLDERSVDLDAEETVAPEGIGDWFDDLGEVDETSIDHDLPEEGDEAEGLPDWLSEMPSEDDGKLSSEEEDDDTADIFAAFGSEDLTPVDELPDWLSEVGQEEESQDPETIETTESETESEDEAMPDWLADLSDEGETVDPDEDTDWFEALTGEDPWPEVDEDDVLASQLEPIESEKETADPTKPSDELIGVPKGLVSPGLPDWLQEDMPEMSALDEEGEQLPQGEIPGWLQQMRPSNLSTGDEGLGEGLPPGETQDEWQTLFEDMPAADRDLGVGGDQLSAAEIPAWLRALKPNAGSEEPEVSLIDEDPETEGPLKGLRGVLQVAPYVTKPAAATEAPQYTISKDQQQQIALLHRLTHEEQAAAKQVVVKKSATFSSGGRALLGLLLLLVIIAGVLLPRTNIALPETALPVPQSALDTYETIDPLVGRSVLVAFEYSPAMAAELDPMALMLLQQLAGNGNRVMTISQSAAGTAIADQMVEEVADLESQSLGLLTGEAVGLQSLGSCLNVADSCDVILDGETNSDIQSDLADLGLIIVLTSERNSLINWIEQVESQTEAPMVVAVSQPLGPLTIPYLSSGQLEGSVDGIPAASAYEKRLLGQDDSTFEQFTAQSIGMWVVIVSLIVAGLFYGLTGFADRRKRKGSG